MFSQKEAKHRRCIPWGCSGRRKSTAHKTTRVHAIIGMRTRPFPQTDEWKSKHNIPSIVCMWVFHGPAILIVCAMWRNIYVLTNERIEWWKRWRGTEIKRDKFKLHVCTVRVSADRWESWHLLVRDTLWHQTDLFCFCCCCCCCWMHAAKWKIDQSILYIYFFCISETYSNIYRSIFHPIDNVWAAERIYISRDSIAIDYLHMLFLFFISISRICRLVACRTHPHRHTR